MKTFIFLLLLTSAPLQSHAQPGSPSVAPPDFKVQVGEEANAKMRGWLLLFTPPEHYHFNLEAPMKVTSAAVSFIKVGATGEEVGYRSSDPDLKEGQPVQAEIFLCDDQKTVCVRKTLAFPLKTNSDLHELKLKLPTQAPVPAASPKSKKVKKKDEFGFWDNDLESARADAATRHLPLLIDFYGIWCPPCNFLNETVFSKPEFKKTAKNWVLLKMDADQPESFELKSHFKVGGYPTVVAVKEPAKDEQLNSLSEINRVVGYFSLSEMNAKLNHFYANRKLGLEEKLSKAKESYSDTLIEAIHIKTEKKERMEALNLVQEGLRVFPNEHFYSVQELKFKAETFPAGLKEPAARLILKGIVENRQRERTETLLAAEELLVSHSDQFSKLELAEGDVLLDTLNGRVDPKTLSVPEVELSVADIDGLRVDLAEAEKDEAKALTSRRAAIVSYQNLMKLHKNFESRGLNLELAYLYSKSGEIEKAKKIYLHFIQKYPREFTFYFAAARMYLDAKDYPQARENAEKAFEFAYGDNQLRALERLLKIQIAQGEKTQAQARGLKYLDVNPEKNPDLSIRTHRYRQALQKTIDEAGKI